MSLLHIHLLFLLDWIAALDDAAKFTKSQGTTGFLLHGDFVEISDVIRAALPPPAISGDLWAEFGSPTSDALIWDADAAIRQHLLNFAQAQVKPHE